MMCNEVAPFGLLAMVCAWIVVAAIVALSLVIALSRLDRRLYVHAIHVQRIDSSGALGRPQCMRCEACSAVHRWDGQPITCACGAVC